MDQSPHNLEHDDPPVSAANGENVGDQEGWKCELKNYEWQTRSNGEKVPLQTGTKKKMKSSHTDDRSALVLSYHYASSHLTWDYTVLDVKSPHLKTALRKTVREYPGMSISSEKICILGLPKCFFHY